MQLFAALGWQTANAYYEAFAPEKATATRPYLGRPDDNAVLLVERLHAALERLNPDLPGEALEAALAELARGRGMMSPVEANRQVYRLLKDGVNVDILDPVTSQRDAFKVRVIDWRTLENNDFLLVQQLWIQGDLHRRRPDLVGFVNGIPRSSANSRPTTSGSATLTTRTSATTKTPSRISSGTPASSSSATAARACWATSARNTTTSARGRR